MSGRIQLGGNITVNAVDYSEDIAEFVIQRKRPGTTRPATFGDPTVQQKAGADEYMVSINFFHDEGDASNFWAEAWAAMDTASAELPFTGTFKPGAVSPTNPKFTGILVLTELDTGGKVGDWKGQQKTFPAHTVVGPIEA